MVTFLLSPGRSFRTSIFDVMLSPPRCDSSALKSFSQLSFIFSNLSIHNLRQKPFFRLNKNSLVLFAQEAEAKKEIADCWSRSHHPEVDSAIGAEACQVPGRRFHGFMVSGFQDRGGGWFLVSGFDSLPTARLSSPKSAYCLLLRASGLLPRKVVHIHVYVTEAAFDHAGGMAYNPRDSRGEERS